MNLNSQIHRISCFPYRHFEHSRKIFLALCVFLIPSQKNSPSLLSHIGRYTSVPKRSLGFARDDDIGIALSKHIRCTLREINPFPSYRHFERSEKSSLHFVLSCSFRRWIPIFRCLTYGAIPVCQKDPSTPLGMTLRGIALSKHIRCTLREINPSPLPSFRAQREIFLALCSFWLLSQKFSHFPLSHIRHYPLLPERSLDFARDDVAEAAFSQHILHTGRGLSIPHTVISSAARNLPCTLLFLASFAEGFPFSAVAHRTLYRCARKIEGFARDDVV